MEKNVGNTSWHMQGPVLMYHMEKNGKLNSYHTYFSGRGVIIPFEEWPFLRNQTIEDLE